MSRIQQQNFLFSTEAELKRGQEQFLPEHTLGYIVSGETRLQTNEGMRSFPKGSIGLMRKNLLSKTIKLPSSEGQPHRSINVFLSQEALKRYAAEHAISAESTYHGEPMIELSQEPQLLSFFDSLIPYFENPSDLNPELTERKTREAIELLIRIRPQLTGFLFDFSELQKIDLEAYMNQNFIYHVPLSQFARLTGRSLATFKRDFKKTFSLPPEKWLLQKRLEQAHFLIRERNQSPSSVYLEVGFENRSHFSYAFKKFFGYNPSRVN